MHKKRVYPSKTAYLLEVRGSHPTYGFLSHLWVVYRTINESLCQNMQPENSFVCERCAGLIKEGSIDAFFFLHSSYASSAWIFSTVISARGLSLSRPQ